MAHGHIFLLLSFISVVFAFTHPGLLVTDADISRIKTKLAAKKEPWQSSWDKLTSIPFSEADYEPNAVSQIFRSENGELLWHDAAAAFNLALRWKINRRRPHNVKHFFANWELCNIASALAVAVLTDNQTVWDFAVDYFKHGEGNGGINNAITNIVDEPGTGKPLGQGQEAGRDQGHSAMNYQLLGVIGQQAWNQGEDLFAYNESRILLGAEYFARYNLDHDVPFEPYTNGIVSFDVISPASRGAIRPAWELLYAHYVQIKGLDAPWTTAYLNNTLDFFGGFEGGAGSWGEGSGHYDGLGWGSLLHHLDEDDVKAASESALAGSETPSTVLPTAATETLPSRPASTLITTSATTAVTTSDAPDTTTQATSSVHVEYGETKSLHSDTEPTSTTARTPEPTSKKVRTGCAARRAHAQRA
ncbi:hypothetical protein NM208_g1192 [Fusarium decemcellulare]|uniref:Uncharacterized protein n=1 Tax=Fusarium decemcellulare TaxID=57161 RepID=A0ACC1SWY4_9HYPO|nr:hypothetical protein NM208_g1192 [Fusarium decemcellulare]